MFHTGTKHRESSPETMVELAKAHRRVTFIFAHMGGVNSHVMVDCVRRLDNVFLETSMSSPGFDAMHNAVKVLGNDRVL